MITCGDCGQTFQKFNSFKSHIQRKHNSRNHHDNNSVVEVEEGGDLDLSAEEDEGREDDAEEPKSFVEEMTRSLALFMLRTKEENQLSQRAIDAILGNAGDLVESSLDHLKEQITTCLERSGVDITEIEGLRDVLERPSIFNQAMQPLMNEYQQLQYFKNHFSFVVSMFSLS